MRRSKHVAGLALLVAAAVFLAAGVASAQTSAVNCGDFVNGNVSLNHDLICPSTDGLIVASPNTTIHLNGHKIVCVNDALPCWTDLDSGIYTDYDNTQIVGPGTISGFFSDVTLNSNANTVKNLNTNAGASAATEFGVVIGFEPVGEAYASNLVTKVTDTGSVVSFCSCRFGISNAFIGDTSTGGGFGFWIQGGTRNRLLGNVATHDGEVGFYLEGADHTLVMGNKADHTLPSEAGGFLDICSTYSTYQNNTSNSNYSDGYDIIHSGCLETSGPVPASFPFDHFAGLQVTFTGNGAKGNGGDGAYFDKADAAEDPIKPAGSEISGNTFVNNGGDGSDAYRTYMSHWGHNTSKGNGGSGYYFDNPAADGINGNLGQGNHEDGLTIYYDSTCEVSGPFGDCDPQFVNYNTLIFNSEFGGFANDIVASIANIAHNNGTAPVDCVNINCVAHAAAAASPALAAKAAKRHAEKTFVRPTLPAPPAQH